MKGLLFATLCFYALAATAQSKTGEGKELNIYARDGKTVIAKVIVNSPASSKLFLIKSIQKKDSANNYVTTFYLGNKEAGPLLDTRILLKFSKPVISVTPSFSAAFHNMDGLAEDHNTYVFKAGRLERDAGSVIVISFVIKSKDRVITEMSGLDGIIP
ncbi:hypothetical protein ACPPVU_20540 [Mucilaginibacter sp. McL0603]|uniref:hypothetical protein n=1 Tax=Mucilaginibacter sp. McL0603 TaxID=3415670 RepID=UPI003CE7451C